MPSEKFLLRLGHYLWIHRTVARLNVLLKVLVINMRSLHSLAISALAFQTVALALSTRGHGQNSHAQLSSINYYPPLDYKPHPV